MQKEKAVRLRRARFLLVLVLCGCGVIDVREADGGVLFPVRRIFIVAVRGEASAG